jgi:hypothetical protein
MRAPSGATATGHATPTSKAREICNGSGNELKDVEETVGRAAAPVEQVRRKKKIGNARGRAGHVGFGCCSLSAPSPANARGLEPAERRGDYG